MAQKVTIAVVGLGYVGLPLAIAFGKRFRTIGYDLSKSKILDYRRNVDRTGEISPAEFLAADKLEFHSSEEALRQANFFVVAVPTPVDAAHVPDLCPLESASAAVGRSLQRGAVVVFESTVFPLSLIHI